MNFLTRKRTETNGSRLSNNIDLPDKLKCSNKEPENYNNFYQDNTIGKRNISEK